MLAVGFPSARRLRRRSRGVSGGTLAPEPELLDEPAIAVHVGATEVVEEAAALAHEHQQPAPRVMVLLVLAKVLGELVDPGREQRHLDLGRPDVVLLATLLLDPLL